MGISNLMAKEPETRRDQVLQAAACCFVSEGFHGASMARIAKLAKMSPGHIYHYFSSKEEIITEIVRHEEVSARAFFDTFRDCSPEELIPSLIGCIKEGVEGNTDNFHSLLTLEILAEAARNEKVQGLVCTVDRDIRANFAEILSEKLQLDDMEYRVELIFALFSGLIIRGIRNPDLDRKRMTEQMAVAMKAVLSS